MTVHGNTVERGDGSQELINEDALFRAYDSLPREFRELYDSVSEVPNPIEWARVIAKLGEAEAMRRILAVIESRYPGFKPIKRQGRS